MDGASTSTCSNENCSGDFEMDKIQPEYAKISEKNLFSKDLQDREFNLTREQDNSSEYERENSSSSLERVLQDEETQGFTSPTLHNASGRQEDVDLMQSLQIREARILNLTRKRDRLLNLTGLKLK